MAANPANKLELSINARSDGTLRAAYIHLGSDRDVARTQELIPSTLLIDFNERDELVGVEILAPVSLASVTELAQRLEASKREAFRNFVTNFTPPALLAS